MNNTNSMPTLGLGKFIKSFRKGLWDDIRVPNEWNSWHDLLIKYYKHSKNGYLLRAKNKKEYVQQISKVLPYLNYQDLEYLYDQIQKTKEPIYFAGPPLLIDNSQKIMVTGKIRDAAAPKIFGPLGILDMVFFPVTILVNVCGVFLTSNLNALKHGSEKGSRFYLEYSGKTLNLPSNNNEHPKKNQELLFSEKAITYAQKHWGYLLTVPTTINETTTNKVYKFKNMQVGVAFNRLFDEMIDDHGELDYELFNNHIDWITYDSILYEEINAVTNRQNKHTHAVNDLIYCDKVHDYLKINENDIIKYYYTERSCPLGGFLDNIDENYENHNYGHYYGHRVNETVIPSKKLLNAQRLLKSNDYSE